VVADYVVERPAPTVADRRTTPQRLLHLRRLLFAVAAVVYLLAALVVYQGQHHIRAARDHGAPELADALAVKAALTDADRAIWFSFTTADLAQVGPGQTFQNDITTAAQLLEHLAELSPGNGSLLQTISHQLLIYQSLVEQADATYRAGVATGSAPQQRLGKTYLVYATNSLRTDDGSLISNVDLLIASGQPLARSAWTRPVVLVLVVLAALLLLAGLLRAQVLFRRLFRRTLNPALAGALVLTIGFAVWAVAVTAHANGAYGNALSGDIPRLRGAWTTQTALSSHRADDLRGTGQDGDADGEAPPAEPAQRLRGRLNQRLDTASGTYGLPVALAVLGALTAGLLFLGFYQHLREYAGWR
jgi:hypothetical protein